MVKKVSYWKLYCEITQFQALKSLRFFKWLQSSILYCYFLYHLFLVLLLLIFTYLTILILVFIILKKLGVRCAPINQFMLDSFYDLIQAPKPWVQSEGKSSNQQELWLAHNTQQYGELWIVTSKLYESINSAPL